MRINRANLGIGFTAAVLLSLLAGACSAPQPASPTGTESAPSPTEAVEPTPQAGGGMQDEQPQPIDVAGNGLPEDVIVSTNEPFWNARAEAGTVVLTGAGQPERTLTIRSSDLVGGKRRIVAGDASEELVVEVGPGPCQDSMSGAEFPLVGALFLAGGEGIEGCARPADMPPPPVPDN